MATRKLSTSRRGLLAGAVGLGTFGTAGLLATPAEAGLGDPVMPDQPADGFLRLTGIPGSSVRDGHEDEIEVLTFHWGATAAGSLPGDRGEPELEPLLVACYSGIHSPLLLAHLLSGAQIASAVLSLRHTIEGETSDYAVLTMRDCRVSGYRALPRSEDGESMDVVLLGFSEPPTWVLD